MHSTHCTEKSPHIAIDNKFHMIILFAIKYIIDYYNYRINSNLVSSSFSPWSNKNYLDVAQMLPCN